jgi:sulfate transport system permease protein
MIASDNDMPRLAAEPPVGGGPIFRRALITVVVALTALVIVAPLLVILYHAFSAGIAGYVRNLSDPATLHAIGLTCLTALVVVPINILFGIAAAWTVTKFDFAAGGC